MATLRLWRHNKIKGVISEAIVEELLRDLGFYVLKMGQEHTINPIIHLKKFIKK
tara:strand:+ start:373 stop:534 length:162 start_codon:yes stop_codon:yes gene_type:complete